jgi:hypothetical protein
MERQNVSRTYQKSATAVTVRRLVLAYFSVGEYM